MKTIKAIYKSDYWVALKEKDNNTYEVQYTSNYALGYTSSEDIGNLEAALMLFDVKLNDLEGNANH